MSLFQKGSLIVDVAKTRNGEWGMGNEKQWSAAMPKKSSWRPRSTATRQGLHVVSERWKARMFICQVFPRFWNY